MKVRFRFLSGESLSINMAEVDSLDAIYAVMSMNGHLKLGNELLIMRSAVAWIQNEDTVAIETGRTPDQSLN